ncbi:MAG: hypothetical protein HQL39_01750 [Alphaproteobacteria bacterium]|nr:hypothetical protein [Alphaproteobacteria bacterium]
MIGLMSVYLTDTPNPTGAFRQYRGQLPEYNKSDVFRYALESLKPLNLNHLYVFCELDESYSVFRDDIAATIEECFPKYTLSFSRLLSLQSWRSALERLRADHPEEAVLYLGNHDHVFVGTDLETIDHCARSCAQMVTPAASVISHWHEFVSNVTNPTSGAHAVCRMDNLLHAISICNHQLLEKVFFRNLDADTVIRRTEDIMSRTDEYFALFVPLREVMRHFDGYCGAGIDVGGVPPLHIPPNFFRSEIRLATGHTCENFADLRNQGYFNVNPFARTSLAVDADGVDFKGVVDDLPMFWKDRIVETKNFVEISREELLLARDAAKVFEVRHIPGWSAIGPAAIRASFPTVLRSPPQMDWLIERRYANLYDGGSYSLHKHLRQVPDNRVKLFRRMPVNRTTPISLVVLDTFEWAFEEIAPSCREIRRRFGADVLYAMVSGSDSKAPGVDLRTMHDPYIDSFDSIVEFIEPRLVSMADVIDRAVSLARGEIVVVIPLWYCFHEIDFAGAITESLDRREALIRDKLVLNLQAFIPLPDGCAGVVEYAGIAGFRESFHKVATRSDAECEPRLERYLERMVADGFKQQTVPNAVTAKLGAKPSAMKYFRRYAPATVEPGRSGR